MDIQKVLSEGFRLDWFESTPVGLYLISRDGMFLRCNNRALRLFGLTPEDVQARRANILDFYKNPREHEKLQRYEAEARDGGQELGRHRVQFHIAGEDLSVEIVRTRIRNEQDEIAGYIDYVLDVTTATRYNQLLDSLSEGAYQVDASDTFVMVSAVVARLFGYGGPADLIGRPLSCLFSASADAEALRRSATYDTDTSVVWRMSRRDGSQFFASITALPLRSTDGTYRGMEGTIRDITRSEQYNQLMSKLPLGFYMLERRDGDDYVQSCNYAFARLFGYDAEKQVIGMRMRDLHADNSRFDEFVARVERTDRLGDGFSDEHSRMKTHDGRTLYVQVTCRLLRNHAGEVMGRVGVIRDITEEEPLRRQIKELTADIGNLLHSYSSTLHTMVTSIRPATDTLLRNPAEHIAPGGEPLVDQARREAHWLGRMVAAFVTERTENSHTKAVLGAEQWEWLQGLYDRIDGVTEDVAQPEMVIPTLYEIAVQVHDLFYSRRGQLDRNSLRAIMNQSWAVERLCAFSGLQRARDAAVTMDYATRALREFVIRAERPEEPVGIYHVTDLVESATHNVADFARDNGTLIDRRGIAYALSVRVVEREMVRALANLLHNAIKYTWSRGRSKAPSVNVRAVLEQSPGSHLRVRIEIENYGVPIPHDEIESGLIFRFGFRGRMAAERRRTGTGVGLTDAKQVVERHGGSLAITSRPASGGVHDDYGQPFVTTVRVFLPASEG